ncbi:hypothetical protein NKG05_02375 [Oerskovia sp. M15]
MRRGRVEVISGPMFAGKTEELMRRVRRAQIAGRAVEVVHHALDDRRGAGIVSSHSGLDIPPGPRRRQPRSSTWSTRQSCWSRWTRPSSSAPSSSTWCSGLRTAGS